MRPVDRAMRLQSERIVTPAGTISGEITIEHGRISALGARSPGAGAVELGSRWIVPGFIDTHVHGGAGAQCNTEDPDEVAAVARFHARHGTTALLATTVSAPVDELAGALQAITKAAADRTGAAILGAHLEGPFLSPQRPGAMDASTFLAPDPKALSRLLAGGGRCLRMMTIAPELPGSLDVIRSLSQRGIVASVGHSDANDAETRAAVAAGARSGTHLFNAMRPLHQRDPGVAGALLDLPEVNCELICDGVHADPATLRLALSAKTLHGIRLVTDAMEGAGMPDGEYRLGHRMVTVRDGRATLGTDGPIAGSTLTMDAAVRNAVTFLGLEAEQAVALAATNPARVLGLHDRKGSIAPGMDADLTVLDDELRACGAVVAGAWVYAESLDLRPTM